MKKASLPPQEGTHWSLYTFITNKRLSLCHQFSASQNTSSISLALNNSCPRCHLHSWSNETVIPLNNITVYPTVSKSQQPLSNGVQEPAASTQLCPRASSLYPTVSKSHQPLSDGVQEPAAST